MRFTLFLLLVIATQSANGETTVLRGAAQGTTYHIKFVEPPTSLDAKKLRAAVDKLLAEIDRQMSTYRADSEISRFNRAPAGEWLVVSPTVVSVVNAARAISEKTDGALDVTVGPLVRLWHFGPREGGDRAKPSFEPPTEKRLQEARTRVGYRQLETQEIPASLKKNVDGLDVDLSSIASGYTIDRLAEMLLDFGIKDYMVELGGEIRASGKRADGTPWRVAVERPTLEIREMQISLPIANAALATAGGTKKFFEYSGKRYSHIIDPATGRPVEHTLSSVTVAAETCIEADGWDTPLLIMGPERGVECAERHGIAAMFISQPDDGGTAATVKTTAAWQKRFDRHSSVQGIGEANVTR